LPAAASARPGTIRSNRRTNAIARSGSRLPKPASSVSSRLLRSRLRMNGPSIQIRAGWRKGSLLTNQLIMILVTIRLLPRVQARGGTWKAGDRGTTGRGPLA
jgi:hypothetical protein